MAVAADHPIQRLLFFVSDDLAEETTGQMQDLVSDIAGSRTWTIAPPAFVDEVEEPEDPAVDLPVRTLGGVLDLYSALPPWGERLPEEVDRAHYEEVEAIVVALRHFSETSGHEVTFELDGTYVGIIKQGNPDRLLADGLLGEWRRHLA